MLKREVFKEAVKELFEAHLCVDKVTVGMLKVWYEECQDLDEKDFIIAIKRARYCEKEPRLYNILTNLPERSLECKSIGEYKKVKDNKPKPVIITQADLEEMVRRERNE